MEKINENIKRGIRSWLNVSPANPYVFNINEMKNEIKKLEHSSYRCQYHIVFAPKYRRKVIYGELKADIGKILRKLCNEKKVEIIEAEACSDHIHMLVSIPPYLSISQFMGYIKSKSALMYPINCDILRYGGILTNIWI